MEVVIYYLLCLLARKKIIVNISYFLGTVVFVSLSYNTANKLYKVPGEIQMSISRSSLNITQISNESFDHGERVQFLRSSCGDKNDPSRDMLTNIVRYSTLLNHLGFVVRSQSLFYCSVPKVATRTLLTYITYLHIRNELINSFKTNSTAYFDVNSNLFNADVLNEMLSSSIKNDSVSLLSLFISRLMKTIQSNSSNLDLWYMYQKPNLPYVRLRTLPDPSVLFSKPYNRVIFVRHPLERLASAYADKIGSLKAEPFTMYYDLRRAICRKYASSYLKATDQRFYHVHRLIPKQTNEPCEKIIPTFEHFVQYIMSDSSQVDVHWQPYSTLCQVCTFKYNVIGKYETIQEDLNLIRGQLGLNSTDWNINNTFSTGKTKQNYKLMYSQLPNHLLCNLKDFYNDDLKFFDYRFEDYLIDQKPMNCSAQRYQRFNAAF